MPTDVQVTMQGHSGLPRDRWVNTLHFDGDQWNNSLLDELWSKYDAFYSAVGGGIAAGLHKIAAYTPGPNPGGPYIQKEYTRGMISASGPTEVCLCLSYATVELPDQSTPRRRGRIYLGPINSGQIGAPRPGSLIQDAVLDLGEGIAQVGLAANVTWCMLSKLDNSYHKIESIWCDDSWDTQRRRGYAPTVKTVRDVQ